MEGELSEEFTITFWKYNKTHGNVSDIFRRPRVSLSVCPQEEEKRKTTPKISVAQPASIGSLSSLESSSLMKHNSLNNRIKWKL